MTERFEGTYFDGVSGRGHAVVFRRVGTSHFAIEGDGVQRTGAIRTLTITPRLARVARTIEFADGARLLLAHDAQIDAWFPRRAGMEAWPALGWVSSVPGGAFALKDIEWRIDHPPPQACAY